MEKLKYKKINSPVGLLKIIANDKCLVAILWDNDKPNRVKLTDMIEDNKNAILLKTEKQLNEYFNNQRKAFDIPFELSGTSFQKEVWRLLSDIPFGSTWSYKDIAMKINNPNAVRAVGTAIGRNPISILIPCHRVIGSDGKLAGFAVGIDKKRVLLNLESTKKS